MNMMCASPQDSSGLPLNRERFFAAMLSNLADILDANIGEDDADGFLAAISHRLGDEMNDAFQLHFGRKRLTLSQLAEALVMMKRSIGGDPAIESISEDRIVLTNATCPFGRMVVGRGSLCAIATGVMGRIAADNAGYARVKLDKALSAGDRFCRIIIELHDDGSDCAEDSRDRQYFKTA